MSKINLSSTVSELFFTKPYYERNITDIKDIYLNHLVRILTPCMFDSIKLIYNKSTQIANGDMTVEYAFKVCLKDLINLSSNSIIKEVAKIKQLSNSGNYFDNLIKSVIKSHIVLLTYNVSKDTCPICNINNYNIDTNNFIHQCYIELGNIIFNDPRIFILCLKDGEGLNNVDGVIRAGNRFDKMVKRCVSKVIFDFIPVNDILVEYLNKEKITDEHIKAKQELEKDELINQINIGVSDYLINLLNDRKEIIINELISKLQNIFNNNNNNEHMVNIENPIDVENKQNTININDNDTLTNKQINNVINNDIPDNNNENKDNEPIEQHIFDDDEDEENKEEKNDEDEKENMKLLSEDNSSDSELELSDSFNEKEDNKEEEKDESKEDDELLLNSKDINEAGINEKQSGGELEEEIKAINNGENENIKDENVSTQQRKRGRPKKFITNNDNKISLNKFKQ